MIYKMSPKEIKKLLHEFYATRYGKSMFVICYVVPFITFMITIGMFLASFGATSEVEKYMVVLTAFLCMNIFCIGSYFYYKELKEFAEHRKK
ncbi:MAG: hypothetical protein IKF19_06780 [Bacilli bacterium]|nr:hypothetical protein [Bacilli bacterium]